MIDETPVFPTSEPVFQPGPRTYPWSGVLVAILGTILVGSYFLLPWFKINYESLIDDYRDYVEDTDLIDNDRREAILADLEDSENNLEEEEETCYAQDGVTGYEIARNYD